MKRNLASGGAPTSSGKGKNVQGLHVFFAIQMQIQEPIIKIEIRIQIQDSDKFSDKFLAIQTITTKFKLRTKDIWIIEKICIF